MINPLTLTFTDNLELEARFRRYQADGLRTYDKRAAAFHFLTLMVAVWRDIWLCATSPTWQELERRMTHETRIFGTQVTHAISLLVMLMVLVLVCNLKLRTSPHRTLYLTITRCLSAAVCLLPLAPASLSPSGLTGGLMLLIGHMTLYPFSMPVPFTEHFLVSLFVLLMCMPFVRGAMAPLGLCMGWKHYASEDAACAALFRWSQAARGPISWVVWIVRDGLQRVSNVDKGVDEDVHVCYMAVAGVQLFFFVFFSVVIYHREYTARVRWLVAQQSHPDDAQHAKETATSSVVTVALLLICIASHIVLCVV